MSIRIEDLDTMDFSDVADTRKKLPFPHPGEVLLEEFLKPMGISQYAISKAIGIHPRRINQIVKGQRSITADTALRLAAFFGTDAQSWINLQTEYDLQQAKELASEAIGKIQRWSMLKEHA